MINKRDNLALHANFVTSVDTFAFLAKECDMKPKSLGIKACSVTEG